MRNLKRALSMGLASVMVMGMMATGAGAAGYEDFADKDEIKNAEAVNTMVSLGVISGANDGTFQPEGTLTRAQMCTLVARMLGGGKDPVLGDGGKSSFKDTQGHWAETYIAYCANLGIIAGVGDGNFKPDDPLNGTAAAKMILCALGYKPEFEGIGGANWELATNTLASKIGLYNDLDSLNPSVTINRDNVAQMIYNGVQALEVEYRNLEGQHDGTVYATEKGTMLWNRFKVRKVEGVVEATDLIALKDGTTVTGKSRLTDVRYNGAAWENEDGSSRSYTYPIDIDDDLLGQRVVIYVKGLSDLSPNSSNMEVIGSVIVSDDNTIVETTGRLKDSSAVKDAVKKGGLSMPTSVDSVKVTEKDDFSKTNGQEQMPGVHQRFIDNDADGTVDVIVAKNPALAKVNTYNTKDSKLNLSGIGSVDFEDILNADEVDAGDYVLVYNYEGTYILEQAESVSGTVTAYVHNSTATLSKITMDGTNYGVGSGEMLASDLIKPNAADQFPDLVDGSYTLYLDPHGNILGYVEDEGTIGNYAVITAANVTESKGFSSAEVKLTLSDGTSGKYDVNLLASAKKWNTTTQNAAGNTAKEDAMATALKGAKDVLVAYTLDDGKVTLSHPQVANSKTYVEATNGNTSGNELNFKSSTASYTFGGVKVMADNKTVFFVKDKEGSYSVVAGLDNLPASGLKAETGTSSQVIYYKGATGKDAMAKAIYFETNQKFTSSSSYAFVTGTYTKTTANGETIHTYPVVLEDGTVTKLSAKNNDGVAKEEAHEYQTSGSYVTFDNSNLDRVKNNLAITNVGANAISVANAETGEPAGSYAIRGAKVWDVQDTDDVFETRFQKDQKVALVLTNEGDVKTAFVYDEMEGTPSPAVKPGDVTEGGTGNGVDGSGNITITAGQTSLPKFKVEFQADSDKDPIVKVNGERISVSKKITRAVATWVGEYQIKSSDLNNGKIPLEVKITTQKDDMDPVTTTMNYNLTYTYKNANDTEAVSVLP